MATLLRRPLLKQRYLILPFLLSSAGEPPHLYTACRDPTDKLAVEISRRYLETGKQEQNERPESLPELPEINLEVC